MIGQGVIPTVLLLDSVSFGGADDPVDIQSSLIQLGVAHYIIPRNLLDEATTKYDQRQGEDEPKTRTADDTRRAAREPWKVVL
jgi:hypothetical protein